MYTAELEAALGAVRQAAEVCRQIQAAIAPEAMEKKDKSPVTIADFASQALICRRLELEFPQDPVIGEEGAEELRDDAQADFLRRVQEACGQVDVDGDSDTICGWIDRGSQKAFCPRFWTLDPIDGTKGFLRKQQYAIALALIVDGEIQLGILGCPNLTASDGSTGVLAWAVTGEGAWTQPLATPEAEPTRLSVTQTAAASEARFCESVESAHSAHGWSGQIASQLNITEEPYRIDSQCKYFAVARGDADIYLRLPTRKGYQEKIWDHAAGVKVVQEAGGEVTDIHGQGLDFRQGSTLAQNQGVVVSNGQFHTEIVKAVQEAKPDDV